MSNGWIELYPSSWLYNAGVIGFLRCLDKEEKNLKGYLIWCSKEHKKYEFEKEIVKVNPRVFSCIRVNYYLDKNKVVNLKGKNDYYPNFIDTDGKQKEAFEFLIRGLGNQNLQISKENCDLCDNPIYVKLGDQNIKDKESLRKFREKIKKFGQYHNKLLGPSVGGFPNSAWNLDNSLKICHMCTFLILHHHLAFTKLSDGTEVFINTPSFKAMYWLNRLFREISVGKESKDKSPLDILGMSLIEYTTKINTVLNRWTAMNIEIVIKYEKKDEKKDKKSVDFYSLPSNIQLLLTDREIASILSQIGEYYILRIVLEGKHDELLKVAHESLRAYIKNEKLNTYFTKNKNRQNPHIVLRRVLDLYAKITDRRVKYGE